MAPQSSAWTGEKPRKAGNGAGRGSAARSGEKVVPISPTGSAQDIHRTPPHSIEAEQGVLGSMLLSPRQAIAECVEKIDEQYFYDAFGNGLPRREQRSEEHTSELQSQSNLVCRLLLEKKKNKKNYCYV